MWNFSHSSKNSYVYLNFPMNKNYFRYFELLPTHGTYHFQMK